MSSIRIAERLNFYHLHEIKKHYSPNFIILAFHNKAAW